MLDLFTLNEIYTNGYYHSLLTIVSIVSVLCGVCVIVTKNPIVSVLFLIGLFFSIASYLMALGLNFIGLSYLLVYVGAVSILFLFILMLINVRISELVTDNKNSLVLASVLGILLLVPLYTKASIFNSVKGHSVVDSPVNDIGDFHLTIEAPYMQNEQQVGFVNDIVQWLRQIYSTDSIYFATSKVWDGVLGEASHITAIGNVIYTNYPILLIVTSIILLLAMVGAIIITINKSGRIS